MNISMNTMEKKELEHSLTQSFYKAFSSREKKILAELFGPEYPMKDLQPRSISKIIAKFQPSVIEKMKVSFLLSHLLQYYVLIDSEKFELADDTLSDGQKAVFLLDALWYKGSYAIGALYLSLLDSSNESYGPPTHYQLACELKRIVQDECATASLTLTDIAQDTGDSIQTLGRLVSGLTGITVTEMQGRMLCNELVIEFVESVNLDVICTDWIKSKGTWAHLSDLVGSLLMTQGIGRYTANLMTPAYPNLKAFLEGMKSEWISVAKYIGFADDELEPILISHGTVSAQLSQFLKVWRVPDCGQRTSVMLRKLKTAAEVQEAQSLALHKSLGDRPNSLDVPLDSDSSSSKSSSSKTIRSTSSRSLKLNIIRSSELTPTTTHHPSDTASNSDKVRSIGLTSTATHHPSDTASNSDKVRSIGLTSTATHHPTLSLDSSNGDKMFVETDSHNGSPSSPETEGKSFSLSNEKTIYIESDRCSDDSEIDIGVNTLGTNTLGDNNVEPNAIGNNNVEINVLGDNNLEINDLGGNNVEQNVIGGNNVEINDLGDSNNLGDCNNLENNTFGVSDTPGTGTLGLESNNLGANNINVRPNNVRPNNLGVNNLGANNLKVNNLGHNNLRANNVGSSSDTESNKKIKSTSRTNLSMSEHSVSYEEVGDTTDLSEQVPPQHTSSHISEDVQNSIVITKHTTHVFEKSQSEENLEVVPCSITEVATDFERMTVERSSNDNDSNDDGNDDDREQIQSDMVVSKKSLVTAQQEQSNPFTVTITTDDALDISQLSDYPVHDAVEQNDINKLKALLRHQSIVFDSQRESDGRTALHVACLNCNIKAVELLAVSFTDMNAKDKDGNHSLHYHSTLSSPGIVTILAQNHSSIDPPTIRQFTPLLIACELGDTETVKILLQYKASVDGISECHTTPLLMACEKGHTGIVTMLLNAKANINKQDKKTGETPLMKACLNLHVDVLNLLLKYSPDLELISLEGRTVITIAVVRSSLDIVKLLLEGSHQTADIHCTRPCLDDSTGQEFNVTPICDAFVRGDMEMSKYLIEKGANFNTTDRNNQAPDRRRGIISPLNFACLTNQIAIVEYVVTLDQFEASLSFIADPILEALRRGFNQCAMILCEKYGGMEKIKQDANNEKRFELARMLHLEVDRQKMIPKPPSSNHTISPEPVPVEQSLSSPNTANNNNSDTIHTPSLYTENTPEHSDSSTESTILNPILNTDQRPQTPLSRQPSSEPLNALDIDDVPQSSVNPHPSTGPHPSMDNSELLYALNIPSSSSEQRDDETNVNGGDGGSGDDGVGGGGGGGGGGSGGGGGGGGGGLSEYVTTDDEDLFKSIPKVPEEQHSEFSAEEYESAGAVPHPIQFADSDSLRSFQGSAVEILFDFLQYLISACLETQTAEQIIAKAEMIGDTKLIHFFTKYFFDLAMTGNQQIVSDFLQGMPSPMNFIFGASFCSRHDFNTVLKNFGREDFPDQLMLALHQFPNSDGLPWSGSLLLDALFSQSHFTGSYSTPSYAGPPESHASIDTVYTRPPESHDSTDTLYTRPPESHHLTTDTVHSGPPEVRTFAGEGHRLGYSETPPGSEVLHDEKTTQSNSLPKVSASQTNQLDVHEDPSDIPLRVPVTVDHTHKEPFGNNDHTTTNVHEDPTTTNRGNDGHHTNSTTRSDDRLTNSTTDRKIGGHPASTKADDIPPTIAKTLRESADHSQLTAPLKKEVDSMLATVSLTPVVDGQHDATTIEKHKPQPIMLSSTTHQQPIVTTTTTVSSSDSEVTLTEHKTTSSMEKSAINYSSSENEQVLPKPFQSGVAHLAQTHKKVALRTIQQKDSPRPTYTQQTRVDVIISDDSEDETNCKGGQASLKMRLLPQREHVSSSTAQKVLNARIPQTHIPSPKPTRVSLNHQPILPRPSLIPIRTPSSVKTKTSSPKQSRIPIPVHKNISVSATSLDTATSKIQPSPGRMMAASSPKTKHRLKVITPPSLSPYAQKKMVSLENCKMVELSLDRRKKMSSRVDQQVTVATTESILVFQDNEVICNPELLFETISKDLCNWKMVGRYLFIDDKDIDKMASRLGPNQDRALGMLQVWRNKLLLTGKQVTYKQLSIALHNSLNDKLILKLKEHHSRNTTKDSVMTSVTGITEEMSITIPLSRFWENLQPFIEVKLSQGYRNVTIDLKFLD